MVASTLVTLAPSTGAGHLELETIHQETVEGSGAFGVVFDLEERSNYSVNVRGTGEPGSVPLSGGVVMYHEDRSPRVMVVNTALRSPDRHIVSPTPTDPEPTHTEGDELWHTRTQGDISALEDVDITFSYEPGSSNAGSEDASKPPTWTAGVMNLSAEPGTHHVGIWVGEVGETTLSVETDGTITNLRTHAGTGHVAGGLDLEEFEANVQHQEQVIDPSLLVSNLDPTVGFKVMQDGSTEVDIEHSLLGLWTVAEFRPVCAAYCVFPELENLPCPSASPIPCNSASLSWEGPNGGDSWGDYYPFWGTDPGSYTFTLDYLVDVYGPSYWKDGPGVGTHLHEHWVILSVGDYVLPS